MTDLYVVPVTKAKLDSIPEDVRVFFAHIGHLRNELMTLQKLLWASQQYETTNEILVGMRAYQSLMVTRLLAGKLMEGWELLRKAYFGAKLSLTYGNRMDASGQNAIAALKRHFDQKGLMHDIRNQFAFHYAPDKIRATLADLQEPIDLKIYVSDQAGNTYYQFSEVIVNTAMLDGIQKGDLKAALKKLMDQVLAVTGDFLSFCDAWISLVLQEYFPEITGLDKLEKVTLSDLPELADIGLDYFTSSAPKNKTRSSPMLSARGSLLIAAITAFLIFAVAAFFYLQK